MEEIKKISKQVIVMRKEFLIDGKKVTPRKGKFCVQACHASLAAILNFADKSTHGEIRILFENDETDALQDWINGMFTKITVSVNSEAELVEIYNKAKEKGLLCSLITDAGLTEFNGVPTLTAVAIGPNWDFDINPITGHLPLL